MKYLWLLVLIPAGFLAYLSISSWMKEKRLEREWEEKDRVKRVKEEVEEEMKGKSPEEKAKLFNEKMKRFK